MNVGPTGARSDDLDVFAAIESQTSDDDKRSLLALQRAVRDALGQYRYLEIGSHLGGSIQPHLLDDACTLIMSIDKRPAVQPDQRGVDYEYTDNSTERMRAALAAVAPDLAKLTTIDGDTRELQPTRVAEPIDLCFIDGEHTDDAATADFEFCLEVLADRGAIVFHDASVVYNGIAGCLDSLRRRDIPFVAYALPSVLMVVEIGDVGLHRSPQVAPLLVNNHVAYLQSLQANDWYRTFWNRPAFRAYRRARAAVGRLRPGRPGAG